MDGRVECEGHVACRAKMLRWLCRGVVLTARRWSQESAACRAAAANKRSAGPRRLTREAGGAGGSRCHGALDGAVLVEQPGGPLALPAGASEALVQNSVFMGSPCASAGAPLQSAKLILVMSVVGRPEVASSATHWHSRQTLQARQAGSARFF